MPARTAAACRDPAIAAPAPGRHRRIGGTRRGGSHCTPGAIAPVLRRYRATPRVSGGPPPAPPTGPGPITIVGSGRCGRGSVASAARCRCPSRPKMSGRSRCHWYALKALRTCLTSSGSPACEKSTDTHSRPTIPEPTTVPFTTTGTRAVSSAALRIRCAAYRAGARGRRRLVREPPTSAVRWGAAVDRQASRASPASRAGARPGRRPADRPGRFGL